MNRPGPARGFSLIEILAAVAVLAILGLILSQITGSVVRSTKQSTRILDAAGQARLAFDRFGFDLGGLVKRKDVDCVAQNPAAPGSDPILQFLSSVTSPGLSSSNNRGISLIAYEVRTHPDNKDAQGIARVCLVRAGKAIPWSTSGTVPAAGFMGLQASGLPVAFGGAFPTGLLPASTTDFDVLAAGAVRMVVGFQLYPDNRTVQLLDGNTPTSGLAQGQIVYSPPVRTVTGVGGASAQYVDLSRVSALIVGLVVVDAGSLHILDANGAVALGAAFATPSDIVNKTPVQAWAALASSASSLPSGVPLAVRQAVRVYERAFPVTPFPTQGP